MNKQHYFEQSEQIRVFLSYLHRFSGSTFVIHVSSKLFFDTSLDKNSSDKTIRLKVEQTMQELARDMSLLVRSNIRVLVVFDPGTGISGEANDQENFLEAPHADSPQSSQSIYYCTQFLSAAQNFELTAVISNAVRAREHYQQEKDASFHEEGQVHLVDVRMLETLLDASCIPVFPSIGWNKIGDMYCLNPYELACALAVQLHAQKLLFLTGDRVFNEFLNITEFDSTRSSIAAQELLTITGVPDEGVSKLIFHIQDAVKQGVSRVHIIGSVLQGELLIETFSHAGSGCMIHTDAYENIRDANNDDLTDIEHIVAPLVEKKYLRKRSKQEMQAMIQHTVVHETDGSIEACCALLPLSSDTAELSMLALAEGSEMLGIGKRMVQFVVERGRELKYKTIFAFSRRSIDWFYSQGFRSSSIENVSEERRQQYVASKSKSRVLSLELH